MQINVRIPRPDYVDLASQGRRGPFAPIVILLEAMAQVDEWMIRQGGYPPLYRSGVRYKQEPPGVEEFVSYDVVLQRGWGDCGHLAPARVGELRAMGIPAKCCIIWRWVDTPSHPIMLVHVGVEYPDGHIEDPSNLLGMRGDPFGTRGNGLWGEA